MGSIIPIRRPEPKPTEKASPMLVIGIDPGVTGALAAIKHSGAMEIHDLPVIIDESGRRKHRSIDARGLYRLVYGVMLRLARGEPVIFVVEAVRFFAADRAGGSAMASLAHSRGVIEGVLGTFMSPVRFVDPRKWQEPFGIKGVKGNSLDIAKRLYPEAEKQLSRVKDHNRADAVLIAHWGHRNLT